MSHNQESTSLSSLTVSPKTAQSHLDALSRAHTNISPSSLSEPAAPQSLPTGWEKMSATEQNTHIMLLLLKMQQTNKEINEKLSTLQSTSNKHAEILDRHETKLSDTVAEVSDVQNALTDRNPTSEIRISGISLDILDSPNTIATKVLDFIDCKHQYFSPIAVREIKSKKPDATSKSIVLEMISDKICDKTLQMVSHKRKTSELTNALIFGNEDQSKIYVSKMLTPYYENLAYQARVAKRQFKWESTWVHNNNISIRQTERDRPTKISTLSQLSNFSKFS